MNGMNQSTTIQTPIEVVLGIDSNGMTTAKKLYEFLELNPSNYSKWYKTNIVENEFATENEDYFVNSSSNTSLTGRGNTQDFKLTAHFAKKLSMKGNGERADQAREYFTTLEERVKQEVIDRSQLSPQMQMFYKIADEQAKMELEQKRQAEKLKHIEQNQQTISDTLQKPDTEEDFKSWCKRCIAKIVNLGNFQNGQRNQSSELYRNAWNESFDRLNQKRPCNLKQRVTNAKGIALEHGKSKTWIEQNINNLSVIAGDKDLRPAYESVMREMMIYYCVHSA